jgi:tRNA G37 N-methylase Trm5
LGVADRVTFTPGSFFTDDLPKADVVMMGHILHDWDLPTKKMLIQKAVAALPSGGALIVYESIIDDDRSKWFDDELEHADRDARRLRLHGRRLRGLDERGRLLQHARRASCRAGLDGGGYQVMRV